MPAPKFESSGWTKAPSNHNSSPQLPKFPSAKWNPVYLSFFTFIGGLLPFYFHAISSDLPVQLAQALNICPARHPTPDVKLLSVEPLMMHITDFISASERKYLLKLGNPLLTPSTVLSPTGEQTTNPHRTSSTAFLPPFDPCVSRIMQRAATFQGFLSASDISVQVTAYQPGQRYKVHYDWFSSTQGSSTKETDEESKDSSAQTPILKRNTLSTIFAILHSTCSDCGTQFPRLNLTSRALYSPKWCEVLDCAAPVLTTRNIDGSALFWVNLDSQGRGREDVLHQGLPAEGGSKVGLNIWTDWDVKEGRERGLWGSGVDVPGKVRVDD